MMNVTINGITKQFEPAIAVSDVIKEFGEEVAQLAACAVSIGGEMFDLDHLITDDCEITLLTFRDIEELRETADEGRRSAAEAEEDAEASADDSELDMAVFGGLSLGNVFSQEMFDAIESEIKSMFSGDFDEADMLFQPKRALELLESVADTFTDPDDPEAANEKEAIYEAVTEAVDGVTAALSDEDNGEILEISEEQLDAIVEMAAAEAALNSENIDELCDEIISGIDEPGRPLLTSEIISEVAARENMTDDDSEEDTEAKSYESYEGVPFETTEEEPSEPVLYEADYEDTAVTPRKSHTHRKHRRRTFGMVKAAAVVAAVAAVGWFGGGAAIQAIGAQNGVKGYSTVSRADIVSKSDVSTSDLTVKYNAAELTFGSANELVTAVQTRLSELGYLDAAQVNGTYDKNTENAVNAFRSSNRVDRTGYIDSETFALLFSNKGVIVVSQTSAADAEKTTAVAATTASTVSDTTGTTTAVTSRLSTTTTTVKPTAATRKTTTTTGSKTTTSKITTTTKKATTTTKKTTTTTKKTTTTTKKTTTATTTTTTTRKTTSTTKKTTTKKRTTTTTAPSVTEPTSATTTTTAATSATTAAPTAAPTTGSHEDDEPALG